jgi:hypothetical protein
MIRSGERRLKSLFWYLVASGGEIAGCFAFWAWLRMQKSPWWIVPGIASLIVFALALTRVDRVRPILPSLHGLWIDPGEDANVSHQTTRHLIGDLSAVGRRVRSLTVEYAGSALAVGQPLLLGEFAEVGNFREPAARPTSGAVLLVALCAVLPRGFSPRGRSRHRRGRLSESFVREGAREIVLCLHGPRDGASPPSDS